MLFRSDMLERSPALRADERSMIDMMRRNSERMQELINDLLDSAALESGQIQFDFDLVDLHTLCAEMAALQQPQADRAGSLSISISRQAPSRCAVIGRASARYWRTCWRTPSSTTARTAAPGCDSWGAMGRRASRS